MHERQTHGFQHRRIEQRRVPREFRVLGRAPSQALLAALKTIERAPGIGNVIDLMQINQ